MKTVDQLIAEIDDLETDQMSEELFTIYQNLVNLRQSIIKGGQATVKNTKEIMQIINQAKEAKDA